MVEEKRYSLSEGIDAFYMPCPKFKKSVVSVSFFVPLSEETACANALLAGLLTRGTKDYDNYTKLNARLNELYGASISSSVSIVGDLQMIYFCVGCIDDKYADGEPVLSEVTALLCDMLFAPMIKDGRFNSDDFESEKRILVEDILAEFNDKRSYALQKMRSIMFENEPFGIAPRGTIEQAKSLTNEQVANAYTQLLKNAFVHINLLSASEHQEIFDIISDNFSRIERNPLKADITVKHSQSGEQKAVTERIDVTQGKLCMGFSVECENNDRSIYALRMLCDIFGGGTYSKLFSNVREKQGLCYYCAARSVESKLAVFVDCGILDETREKAQESILHELSDIQNGGIDEDLLNTSKKSTLDLITSSITDSIWAIDSWYASRPFMPKATIESFREGIKSVTLDEIIEMSKKMRLDTVYYLGTNEKKEADGE